jgi:hypothetical protein
MSKTTRARTAREILSVRSKFDSEMRSCEQINPPRSILIFALEAFEGALMHPFGPKYHVVNTASSNEPDR